MFKPDRFGDAHMVRGTTTSPQGLHDPLGQVCFFGSSEHCLIRIRF